MTDDRPGFGVTPALDTSGHWWHTAACTACSWRSPPRLYFDMARTDGMAHIRAVHPHDERTDDR
jgi:hypothetical protein